MSRKKISTTIYVTPEQADRLRVLHERTKVPVAVYIREGIDLVLRQYDHLLPGQLPLASPRGDGETPAPPSVEVPASTPPRASIAALDAVSHARILDGASPGGTERGRMLDVTSPGPPERRGSDIEPDRAAASKG